jgi:hypothetical protein
MDKETKEEIGDHILEAQANVGGRLSLDDELRIAYEHLDKMDSEVLSDVIGCSERKARRKLDVWDEVGMVEKVGEGPSGTNIYESTDGDSE